MPTICAALEIDLPADRIYDGKNILPAISGKLSEPVHQELYFDGNDGYWAVREGAWKLVYSKQGNLELYNLEEDMVEQNDLASQNQDKVNEIKIKYEKWRSEMGKPMGKAKQKSGKKNKK